MTSPKQNTPLIPLVLVVILCALAVVGALAVHHTGFFVAQGLHDGGVPYVSNNDGYFHLLEARSLAEEGRGVANVFTDSRQSMLLPHILAVFAGNEASALQQLAAYIGPILGLTMLLGVLPWGIETRSGFVVFGATLLALLAPYWLVRTHVGSLDTDSLVPGLCLFGLYAVYRFATAVHHRSLWAGLYLLTTAFLWFWWRPGAYLSAGYVLLYLVYPSESRTDRYIKVVLGACLLSVAGLAASSVQPFAGITDYVIAHIKLAFGGATDSLLSSAISELKGVGIADLGRKSLGSPWLLLIAMAGTAFYCWRKRWQSLFLVAGWAFGVASLISQRFIPLFVPVGAFFAVYGVFEACNWLGKFGPRLSLPTPKARAVLLSVFLPVLFWGVVSNSLSYKPKSYFSRSDFELAETVRTSFPPETIIWTWWDFGYFFQYHTGLATYFDGGSQTDATCFVAAHPLMQSNTDRAAAWMRHFSRPSGQDLDLSRKGNSWRGYLDEFEQKLVQQNVAGPPVALVLPARVYTTVGYLYSFAHIFDETIPAVVNHLDLFPKDGFSYSLGGHEVVVPEVVLAKGYDSFGAVLNATGKSPVGVDFAAIPDPYIVFSDKANFLAVTDRLVVDSVLFRLLGLFTYDKRHFEPVVFGYRSGGAWRVYSGF